MLKGNRRNFFGWFYTYIPVILRLEGPVFVAVMSHIGFCKIESKALPGRLCINALCATLM